MSKRKKIMMGILLIVWMIGIVVVSYKLIENNVTNRANLKFTVKNSNSNIVDTISHEKDEQSYVKVIENIKLELTIPNKWQYEEIPQSEENDFYQYALKLYKNNENEYAILYFYKNQFAVCGTGRTSQNITLNNGKEATIGYYDGKEEWSDISFYPMNKKIAFVNYGLINTSADEIIEWIKTINISENNE